MKSITTLLSIVALAITPALADNVDPYKPIGTLDVSNKHVRSGIKAHLTWNIIYPEALSDLVIPGPGGRVTTTEDVRVKMRVAGVAFQSGPRQLPVVFNTQIGSGPWQQLFVGTGNQVSPTEYVFDEVVPAGTDINFGGQGGRSDGGWYDPRWTSGTDLAVTGLFNGDSPPDYAPAYEQGEIEDYLSSFISEDNRIQIGPRDMIYLFELASRNPGDWWFDMQDLVVVVTYERVSSNGNPRGRPFVSQNNGLHREKASVGRKGSQWQTRREKIFRRGTTTWFAPSGQVEVRD